MTRPLRLRWSPSEPASLRTYLQLQRDGLYGECLAVGFVVRDQSGPNTYRAVTATGQILRGNNRRRLQRRLLDAVRAELGRVAGRRAT